MYTYGSPAWAQSIRTPFKWWYMPTQAFSVPQGNAWLMNPQAASPSGAHVSQVELVWPSQPASLEVCSVLPRPESHCHLECVCLWDKPWILPNCTSGGCLSVHALLLVAWFLQHDHNWQQISEPRLYTCGLDSDCALLL